MIYSEKAIKAAVSSFPPEAWTSLDGDGDSKLAELVAKVSWLYSVEHWRAGAMAGLPVELLRNGERLDKREWPVMMNLPDLIYRYSLAMDLYAEAYLFQVTQGGRVVEVKWFDPSTINIEANSRVGLVGFTRTLGASKRMYPVKNGKCPVMWAWLPGLKEIGPGDPPANVVEDAAQTLRYMTRTTKGFFEKGAIDNWVLFGPQAAIPKPQEKGFLRWWRRIMMGGQNTGGSMQVLSPDSRLQQINSPINDWVLPELNDISAEQIATSHQTPLMLLRPEQGADKAMMERVTLNWINGVIIPQAQRLVDVLNFQLFDDLGYELVINAESMNVNMQEETEKAQAFATYVAAGVPPETAAAMLGLDVPEGMSLVDDTPEPEPAPMPAPVIVEPEDTKSFMQLDEERQLRQWLKNRDNPDLSAFKANHLTARDKAAIAYEVANRQDAPFPGDDKNGKTTYP